MMNSEKAPSSGITLRRRADRAGQEMLGICRGLLADGHVSQMEAEFLRDWINSNAGRKIEKAMELKSAGHDVLIIGEAHWCETLL